MIKSMAKEIKQFKKASIAAPIFMIGEVTMEMFLPFIMALIIDQGVAKNDLNKVIYYGLIMIIIAIASLIFGVLSAKCAAYASSGVAMNLRKAMFHNIQTFSFSNIDKYSTAGLLTRMTTDVTNVQNAYQMLIRLCIRAPFTIIIAMVMTFSINASLATVFVYAVIFLSVSLYFIMTRAHKYFVQGFAKYEQLNASTQENLTNIRVVKAYVKEDEETKKFSKAAQVIFTIFGKAENTLVFNNPLMQLTMYVCIMVLSWFGAKQIVIGNMQTGELMSMITYTFNILMALMILSMLVVQLSMSVASLRRIKEVIDEESNITNPTNPTYQVNNGDVTFNNVDFAYFADSEANVLSNINLKIKAGETIGIIGGTGSAKTSLVQLISRLYDTTSGEVLVGNVNVKDYDLETLRNEVSVVLQKNVLFSGSIKENLLWGNKDASEEQIINATKIAQAHDFIMEFTDGYDTFIEQNGNNVSGGQKQRICIARAILKDPKILILDDSTSAVDTTTDYRITNGLRSMLPNTTKIIVAQRISSIQHADRIIVMDDGLINGIGSHEQLLTSNEIYQEVYETQKVGDDNE